MSNKNFEGVGLANLVLVDSFAVDGPSCGDGVSSCTNLGGELSLNVASEIE